MKFTGEHVLHGSPEQVWAALLDPAILVRTIPGCERLVATGENAYDMTVTAGVAAVKGTYTGTCVLGQLQPHESLVMDLQGAGAPGTIGARVAVSFVGQDDGTTRVGFDADAVVGGMLGGVGQRMLSSVSKRMATEFFGNVDRAMHEEPLAPPAVAAAEAGVAPEAAAEAAGPAVGAVYSAPVAPAGDRSELLTGIAIGAGLVALGVVLGSVFGRRR